MANTCREADEPTNVVSGRAAISEVADKLLEQFGPTFAFVPEIARLWVMLNPPNA